ncbi:MAG: MFS transporter [Bryobacterales bacterium]|nr:MFS transporter [Bryobacterales bacterium]MDE0621660.1 MFS transporter [Bryobacterales bacterium]
MPITRGASVVSWQIVRARHKVLGYLFVLMLITYLDRVCFSTTASAMADELGLSLEQIGMAGSFFVLGYVLFEIPGGWLADRYGARLMLTRIVIWWSAFTALTGAAWNFAALVAIRFLFGCGEAGAFPGSTSAIARWFPRHELGRAQSIVMFGSRIGFAMTSWVVIALMTAHGWRSVYWIFAVLGVVWAIGWGAWFRDTPESHPAVDEAELALIREHRSAASHGPKIHWGTLLTDRNVWALCGMYSGYTWGLYFYIQWLPTYLESARGLELPEIGPMAAAVLVSGAVANLLGGWVSDRLVPRLGIRAARRTPAIVGLLAAAVFLALAATTSDNTLSLVFLGLSFGSAELILAVTWATCLDIGGSAAGVVSGTMNSLGQIGGALAPWLIGLMVDRTGSWQPPLLVSSAYYLASALLWLLIEPSRRLRISHAQPSV